MAAEPVALPVHVTIAPMRRRHLRSVLRIEAQVYPRPWSLGLFMSELALKTTRAYFVAKVANQVVGYAGLMITGSDGHVTTIAVDPEWQRQHIGTRLLLALTNGAVDVGCTGLTLEVRVTNVGAQAMYREFGFAPAGIRKNYYTETNEDAIVMWAHDIDLDVHRARVDAIADRLRDTTTWEPS
ncbi:MAG: [ribosomal protein S18]-alanine N-acetyltransferase [Actinomycetota bacterium]|jgi:ribosomal-protein-alanine N-acetyltransferase|nr:[ribosomal protein S18]-alanine N-acetyltransferase [Actinomycetota bacterium]